ncbi:hypothetical protein B0J17DRAFT_767735 [Rhizoctonia solani]|nr:hypothetical protein B0J17DRAFT_767735 [Rhizoctonia solani]
MFPGNRSCLNSFIINARNQIHPTPSHQPPSLWSLYLRSMTPRTTRPTALQNLSIPAIVIHYAEPTAGLTPRTPYSRDSTEDTMDQDGDDIHIKVHLSPSAPITPVLPRIPQNKPVARKPRRTQPQKQPNRGWRALMWPAVLALFITALWSLRLHKFEFGSRPPTPPNPRAGKPMEWITIRPHKASATPATHSTRAPYITHATEGQLRQARSSGIE